MQDKFEIAMDGFPLEWEELLAELDFHMKVEATEKDKYYNKYIATLTGCSYDVLDTFSTYLSSNSISLHLMDEDYVGFGNTKEEAKAKCLRSYFDDFTQIFSNGAMQLEAAYNKITYVESEAIRKFMEYEEKVKNLTSKA